MKKIALCLSLFISNSVITMEAIVPFKKKTDSNRPAPTIDARLENLDTLCKNSTKEHSYIVCIPSKLKLKFQVHYFGTSKGKIIESFSEKTERENTYYAFYENDSLIVEKENTDNIVQEATRALTYYEHKWSTGETPDITLNTAAYYLFRKVIERYPQEINQPSLSLAFLSYKAWEEHGGEKRHKIPFAYEVFDQDGKNNCF